MNENLITASELSKLIRLSVPTIYRHIRYGTPHTRNRGTGVDVNRIPCTFVGGRRYWSRSAVVRLIKSI